MGDLPQEFADIFVKDKNWSDCDLIKFKTHKYKPLPEKTVARLMKIFHLCTFDPNLLPQRPFNRPINVAEVTVAMASQLMTMELVYCLISDDDKVKPKKDWVYPNYVTDPKVYSELSNEILDQKITAFVADDPIRKDYDFWLRNQPIKVQVAITAFIATISLRVVCKNIDSVEGYMKRNLGVSLQRFYSKHTTFTKPIVVPSVAFLTKLSEKFQLQSPLCSNFYATCLDAYHTEYLKPVLPKQLVKPTERTNIIASALLASTSCNGLYMILTCCTFNMENEAFLTVLKSFKDDPDTGTAQTAKRLLEFIDRYKPNKHHINCHRYLRPGQRDILWPWARILDATYFKSLRLEANALFFVKFARSFDPSNDFRWRDSTSYKNISPDIEEKGIKWYLEKHPNAVGSF